MTHIAFITLFLGLVFGPQRVEMNVTGPAARIELQLDGHPAAVMTKPWNTVIDFGHRLVPHRLVARALDNSGNEIARAEQTVNVPRPFAEVHLVLERDGGGQPAGAQILWQSLEADRPKRVVLSLDGKPLPFDANLHAVIPRVDVTRPHLLRVRAVSPLGAVAESELAFGGGLEGESGALLTAVAVRLRNGTTPSAPQLEQWLKIQGASPHVIAVEDLPGDVIIVRHPINMETALRLDPLWFSQRVHSLRTVRVVDPSALATHPTPIARFVWPTATRTSSRLPADLFGWSPSFEFRTIDDFKAILAHVSSAPPERLRFADAVAVAGLQALSARRPRAVVLVWGEGARDTSDFLPAQVREYLRSIGVPLYVWSLSAASETAGWGDVTDISTIDHFRKAFEAVQNDLRSQRIVWIDGDYLPAEVEASGGDVETLARR